MVSREERSQRWLLQHGERTRRGHHPAPAHAVGSAGAVEARRRGGEKRAHRLGRPFERRVARIYTHSRQDGERAAIAEAGVEGLGQQIAELALALGRRHVQVSDVAEGAEEATDLGTVAVYDEEPCAAPGQGHQLFHGARDRLPLRPGLAPPAGRRQGVPAERHHQQARGQGCAHPRASLARKPSTTSERVGSPASATS